MPVRAIWFLRAEDVARMNRRITDFEIVHDIHYPEALFGNRFLKPTDERAEYLVRGIWRTENGWWDGNPTLLHSAHPRNASRELLFTDSGQGDDISPIQSGQGSFGLQSPVNAASRG